MLKARIRNVLGVKHAEFPIGGIVLIAGRNGEGKSSLIEALSCAAQGTAAARGMTTKAQQVGVLHAGAEAGSATLDWGTGSQRVVWPAGKVESMGEAGPAMGSALAMGITRWSALTEKQRVAEFAARNPPAGLPDLIRWMEKNEQPTDQAGALWQRIDVSGWDAVHKTATEASAKMKGAWEQVTKENWGVKKAPTWRPETLLPDEPYSLAAVEADLDAAKEALETLVASGAVERERLDGLLAQAAHLGDLKAQEAGLASRLAEMKTAQAGLTDVRTRLLREIADLAHACPHCEAAIEVAIDPATGIVSEIAKSDRKTMTPKQVERQRRAAQEASEAAAAGQGEVDKIQAQLVDAEAKRRRAEAADAEATRLQASLAAAPSVEALAQARLLVASLETRHLAVKAMLDAGAIYRRWAAAEPLIKALAPDGVRAMKATEALEAWNERMAKVAKDIPGEFALAEDMNLTLNGRTYALLSESERWRCDAVMTMALAQAEPPPFVMLDRLDVLVADARAPIFRALAELGVPAVVACSVPRNAPEVLPPLKKIQRGAVWWMEAGTLTELPY